MILHTWREDTLAIIEDEMVLLSWLQDWPADLISLVTEEVTTPSLSQDRADEVIELLQQENPRRPQQENPQRPQQANPRPSRMGDKERTGRVLGLWVLGGAIGVVAPPVGFAVWVGGLLLIDSH
jgi:hypothetical protein